MSAGKPINSGKNIAMRQQKEQYWRSIESSVDVKDYFDNKISMRRSIDKKLHYDYIKNNAPST